MNRLCLFAILIVFNACKTSKQPESPDVWKKISLDFKQLDNDGRAGGPNGKVAVNYEFCIPAEKKRWKQVRSLDPTAKKNPGKGRVGCKEAQWLVIGSTKQKNYQRVLFQLASLPYVERIEQVFWE